jgi:cellulose synthase (UDP-forming)
MNDLFAEIASLFDRGRALFAGPSSFAPWDAVWLPALVCFAAAFIAIEFFPAHSTWLRAAIVAALFFLWARYLLWRLFSTLNLDDAPSTALSVGFFSVEILVFVTALVNTAALVPTRDRRPEADRLSQVVESGRFAPAVDVFIATYSEPISVLRRTVIGCQAIDYEKKRVYLLDDGRRPEVRALAEELGCEYVTRPDNRHFKAGNLNHALARTKGDLVACFDADFVPARDFLLRTAGFFLDPQVALVQTPQTFYNPDPVQRNLGLEDVLLEENAPFFFSAEASRDALGALICHGTSFVVRRRALESIGGVPTESITEDMALSVRLAAAGWKLVNLGEALSVGMAAEEIGAYVDQRLRWTRGNMQLFFSREANPLTVPGLRPLQRVLYFFGCFGFFSMCFVRVAYLALPLAYLLFGIIVMRASLAALAFYQFPYLVLSLAAGSWLRERTRSPFWDDVYATLLCLPQCRAVAETLLWPFGAGFKVTPKGIDVRALRLNGRLFWPLAAIGALLGGGLSYRLATDRWSTAEPEGTGIVYFWTVYSLVYIWLAIQATFDCPQERASPRVRERLACRLRWGEGEARGATIDISEGGARVEIEGHVPAAAPPGATLDLPLAGLEGVPISTWRREPDGRLGVAFGAIGLERERRLVEYLFCRRGVWGGQRVDEARSIGALLKSIFRLYPLAATR